MTKILFVDDEQRILDSLRRMLRFTLKNCDAAFACGPQEALELLRTTPFDVVVSDMLMEGMNGAELLARIKELYPDTLRIILSGHSELEITLQTVRVAHQYLTKPCHPQIVSNVIERACNLQSLLKVTSLRALINGLDILPSLPSVYEELNEALTDPGVSSERLAAIAEQDMAMCAKILQVVNSAFFGLAKRITDLRSAIDALGANMIKTLALSIGVFRSLDTAKFPADFPLRRERDRSILAAHLSRYFFTDKPNRDDAHMACLLQDIGQVILAENFPTEYAKVSQAVRNEGLLLEDAEERTFGVSHAEIGAYLLGIWGLPYPIVEAVAYHHRPQLIQRAGFDVLSGTCVANMLAYGEMADRLPPGDLLPYRPPDRKFLQSLEVTEAVLETWRGVAKLLADKQLGPAVQLVEPELLAALH